MNSTLESELEISVLALDLLDHTVLILLGVGIALALDVLVGIVEVLKN